MLTKVANAEDHCTNFRPQPHCGDDDRAQLHLSAKEASHSNASQRGEIADDQMQHRPRQHQRNGGTDRAAANAARQTSRLSSTESHAAVGWLKNNAPAWLLAMLGLTPPPIASHASPTPQHSESVFGVAVAQHESAEAAEVLAGDVRLWQNRIYLATDDLHDIVAHPSQHPPATVDAAQTMLDYPDEFRKADGANTNGSVDGQIWKQDLIVYAKNVRAAEANAASNKGMPTDEQALAHFMQLALEAAAARAQQARQVQLQMKQSSQNPAAAEARQALQNDADLWNGKSTLSAADLQQVLCNPTAHPPQTVVASLYMLQHPENFRDANALTSGRSIGDVGTAEANNDFASRLRLGSESSRTDVSALIDSINNDAVQGQSDIENSAAMLLASPPSLPLDTTAYSDDGPEAIEAMKILLDDASLWVNKNGNTAQDLQNVVDHPEQNAPDTVAAATFLLQHPGTFKIADGLASGGAIDGQIWKRDLVAAIDQANAESGPTAGNAVNLNTPPLDTTGYADDGPEAIDAMKTLLNDASLWVGKNGNTAQDLQNVVDHPDENAPDTVAAATFLLQHPNTFRIADGLASGGAIDGQIWKRDLVAAIDQANAATVPMAGNSVDRNTPPLDTTGYADDGPEAIGAMKTLLNDASLWVNKNGNTAQDLQNVVDYPEKNAPDTVAAATFLLQHPNTFKIADGLASGGAIDGQIWKRDLVAAIDQANAAAPSVTAATNPNEVMARIRAELESTAASNAFADDDLDDNALADDVPGDDPTADFNAA